MFQDFMTVCKDDLNSGWIIDITALFHKGTMIPMVFSVPFLHDWFAVLQLITSTGFKELALYLGHQII